MTFIHIISDLTGYIYYFIHFEWVGDAIEAARETFSTIGEFSVYGAIFGILSAGIVFVLRKWLLNPFLEFMKPGTATLTMILTFVITFVAGYLLGKRFEDTG